MTNPKAPKIGPENVPETVDAVTAWIRGSDRRARVAWQAEKARAGEPRKGVAEAVRAAGVRVKG